MTKSGSIVGVCSEKVPAHNISRGWGIGKLKDFVDKWVDSGESLRLLSTGNK
jgi:hypothetical protein